MRPSVSQIPALTGVRILAAAWVVIAHFRFEMFGLFPETQVARDFVEGGYLGVEVFFVLSGFIISHNYASRFRKVTFPAYRDFLQKRVARIYPVHLITLLAVVVMVGGAAVVGITLNSEGSHNPLNFIMNLLMLQALPPAFAWNAPAWSISAEMGAYAFFPLIAVAVMRVKSRRSILLVAGAALAFTAGGLMLAELAGGFSSTSHLSIWLRISGEFVAGCFLWRFWHEFTVPGRKYDALAIIGAAGTAAWLMAVPGTASNDFLALPFIALIILGCAGATGPVRRFLSWSPMEYGGRISYSLYMVHYLVLMAGNKLLPWESFEDSPALIRAGVLASYLIGSFVLAELVYRFVEEPGRKYVQQLGRKREEAKASI